MTNEFNSGLNAEIQKINHISQGIGYAIAQGDLVAILHQMDAIDIDTMRKINMAIDAKFKERWPNAQKEKS